MILSLHALRKKVKLVTFLVVLIVFSTTCNDSENGINPGQEAPSLTFEKLIQAPSDSLAIDQLEGQAIVLEFWATWCGPCIDQIPHFNNLVETSKDKDVQFISITPESLTTVRSFLDDRPIKGWIGIDSDRSIFKNYNILAIPRTVLVYPDGEIAAITRANKITKTTISSLAQNQKLDISTNITKQNDNSSNIRKVSVQIKPTNETYSQYTLSPSEGKLQAKAIQVEDAMRIAYDLPTTRIKGPENLLNQWLAIEIFLPEESERFKSLLREELESEIVYKAKYKLEKVDAYVIESLNSSHNLRKSSANTSSYKAANGLLYGTNSTMDNLAQQLEQELNNPVINETELNGSYDWKVKYNPKNKASIIDSVEMELGLQLSSQQRQVEFLYVTPMYNTK